MIIRNEYKGELALGRRLKTTAISSLDTVTEVSQTMADTVTTVRSAIELVHGALQIPIMEQRIELAQIANKGIKDLMDGGMTQKDAYEYLQLKYTPPVSNIVKTQQQA